ncbi:extracellular solute-binding protein [Paenibacillus gansuensis]|uniref:Extracellular solute-binding protein n=1 Tax=Paenibacillus gansuensis TaxID=306542 RepID=A0ABW5PH30_9BACL
MNKRQMYKISAAAMIAMTLLVTSACSGSNSNDNAASGNSSNGANQPANQNANNGAQEAKDPFGPLAEKTEVSIFMNEPDGGPKALDLPDGETVLSNRYTKALSEKLNIEAKFPVVVKGAAGTEKTNLMIASNDITDIILVNYTQYLQMVKSDMVEDLTDVYNEYASPALKEVLQTDEGKALELATIDGKLYGIPSMGTTHNSDPLIWLRKDWLDKLGLKPPTTVDELTPILKAFVEKDPDGNGKKDTAGLATAQGFTGATAAMYGLDPYFDYQKSYVRNWVKGEDGTIQYGSIQPQTKDALAKLRDLYSQGLIPREFAILKVEQATEQVVSGKAGAFFGPWWSGWSPLNDAIKTDPSADWQAYALKDIDGKATAKQETPIGSIAVVKKGFKHPEALVKIINYEYQVTLDDPSKAGGDPYAGLPLPNFHAQPVPIPLWRADSVILDSKGILAASKGEPLPEVAAATAENYKKMGELWAKGIDWLKKNPDSFAEPFSRIVGVKPIIENDIQPIYSEFYGSTKTMERRMTNLDKLEIDAMIKIITGEKPIEYFDEFVTQWKKMGGDQITEEINESMK